MRLPGFASALLLGSVAAIAPAQALPSASFGGGDLALTYHWVHTNTLGGCGCFGLNGVGLSGSWNIHPPVAIVAEASVEHTAQGPSGGSLTLSSYLAGARYFVRMPSRSEEGSRFQPFAQMLVGLGHAGGGVAGPGDRSNAFIGRIGGGMDYPLSPRLSLRLVQVDYDLTAFGNSVNNHQNNILIATGFVFQWAR